MKQKRPFICILAVLISVVSFGAVANTVPSDDLIIYIIRHGEKPASGDNLSCQGENRALQLATVLNTKIGVPDHIYIPTVSTGKSTTHARMFQTVTPFAVKYNLRLNSEFDEKDAQGIAEHLLTKNNSVLLVWEHSVIQSIAENLGVSNPPAWNGSDFDSIWMITFSKGDASLDTTQKEGITPSSTCVF